jgi:hypothetical protein
VALVGASRPARRTGGIPRAHVLGVLADLLFGHRRLPSGSRIAPLAMLAPPQARRLGPGGVATQEEPSTVNSNASLAPKVERNLHRDNDFSLIKEEQSGAGRGPFTEPTSAAQTWRRQPLFMPRTLIQEGTLNEDRVEFRLATFSGGGCRRVFAADGRRRGGHFRDVENPPARAD